MANNPKFQVFKSPSNGQYYYRLKSRNGENILSGEGYVSKQACLTGISSVKSNASYDVRFERKISANNQYFFVLKASNSEVIGVSETYVSSQGRETGIEAVKRDAPVAAIEDLA